MDPFATVNDLKARWADFPTGQEATAGVKLSDPELREEADHVV